MKYFVTQIVSDRIAKTPEGYLLCSQVPIARAGVMEYRAGEVPIEPGEDGIIRVTRSEEEVFNPQAVASFEGKSLTVEHPGEWVGPDNWQTLTHGNITNVRRGEGDDADKLLADILVTSSEAIELIENGVRELSCGYDALYTETGPGEAIQTEIRGNHVALTESGRAGAVCAVRDHKKIGDKLMSLKEKFMAAFGKTLDAEFQEEKEMTMEEALAKIKELEAKLANKGKAPAKETADEVVEAAAPVVKEEVSQVESTVEERLSTIEAAIEKLMQMVADLSGDESEEDGEEFEEETLDAEEEVEITEDAEEEEKPMPKKGKATDANVFARAEVLCPGIAPSKNMKSKALKSFYSTTDGKKIILAVNGGKAPTYDSAAKINMLFNAASEVLMATRTQSLAASKSHQVFDSSEDGETSMSAEKQNELNASFWNKKK